MTKILPPLRRGILLDFLKIIGMLGVFATLLLWVIYFIGRTPPQLLHRNYDSIAFATQMKQSWHALWFDSFFPDKTKLQWEENFEQALVAQEKNITEPGEKDATNHVVLYWENYKKNRNNLSIAPKNSPGEFTAMDNELQKIIDINEKGMFQFADHHFILARNTLIIATILFFSIVIFGIFAADTMADQVAAPIVQFAEILQMRPKLGKKLNLPQASTLEFKILITEFDRLWENLSELNSANVKQLEFQKKRLETILSSLEDGILMLDTGGVITHSNLCFQKMMNLVSSEINGQKLDDLPTSSENYLKIRSAIDDILKAPNAELTRVVEVLWDEESVFFKITGKPILDDKSNSLGHILFFTRQ